VVVSDYSGGIHTLSDDDGDLEALFAHAALAGEMAPHPGGALLARASEDGLSAVLEPGTGRLLARLTEHGGEVGHAAWSPDGQRLATVSSDGQLYLWDLSQVLQSVVLECLGAPVARGISRTNAVIGGSDAGVCAIDPQSGETRAAVPSPEEVLAASAVGSLSYDAPRREAVLRDPALRERGRIPFTSNNSTNGKADPDGRLYLTDGDVVIAWDGESVHRVSEPEGRFAAHFLPAPTRDRIVFAGQEIKGAVIATFAGEKIAQTGGESLVSWGGVSASIDLERGLLATGHGGGEVLLWRLEDGAPAGEIPARGAGIARLAFAPDGRLATADALGRVEIYAPGGAHLFSPGQLGERPNRLIWSPDGALLATSSRSGQLRVWDTLGRLLLRSFENPQMGEYPIALVDGGLLAHLTRPRLSFVYPVDRDTPTRGLSNLRVCRESYEVVPVLPPPTGHDPWAPAGACGR